MLLTQEHYELMDAFEREFRGFGRLDREAKEYWPRHRVYQDARVNDLFLAYRHGYALGKAIERDN